MKTFVNIGILFSLFVVPLENFTHSATSDHQKVIQSKDSTYTFQKNVLPLLQANCNPCHFTGGKVYKKLSFDDYKTVTRIGKKLNTRLKEKEQQGIINKWIESGAMEKY